MYLCFCTCMYCRYILDRVCEDFGVIACLDPKPMPGMVKVCTVVIIVSLVYF